MSEPSDEAEDTPTTYGLSIALEGSFAILPEHSQKHAQTLKKALSDKNRNDKCNRLLAMITWIKETYPDTGNPLNPNHFIRPISDEEKADQFLHFHKMEEDFIYEKIDYPVIGAFLSTKKTKADGKLCSYSNYSKYKNAIFYGANQRRVRLPDRFIASMEALNKSYKNEFKKAERRGEVDKNDSDPITRPLYLLMVSWFLEAGSISNWLFSLLQWNCIGRSISIDPLGFQNFHMATDGMKIEYEFTKADQSGEKVKGKNIYANPFDPTQCSFTGLGIYLSLNHGSFRKCHHFFIRAGKIGSAAQKYCLDLMNMFKEHQPVAQQYCRVDRTGSHGTRKGAGTYSTSGTTFPPLLSSVAHRGDWSQGQVFDVYLQFADPGDQYLGRILAGLDPNTSEFASLPPHFTTPSTDTDVEDALKICFGDLAEKYNFKGQLMLCLASMIHHVDWIKEIAATIPGHPFNILPILRHPDLVQRLKLAVSTLPSKYLSQATGIPPHVNQLTVIKQVATSLQAVVLKLDDLMSQIAASVTAAIESNDLRSGAVTMSTLKEHLNEFGQELSIQIVQKLEQEGLLSMTPQTEQFDSGGHHDSSASLRGNDNNKNKLPTYQVTGSECTNWDVPLGFCFPQKMSRQNGWQAWVLGFRGNEMIDADGRMIPAPIRPIRCIRPQFLPTKKLKNELKTQWVPIFSMMEEGIKLEVDDASIQLPKNSYACSEALVLRSYAVGTAYLKRRDSYIWKIPRCRPDSWAISFWSKKVSRGQIEKFGSDTDKQNLPPATKSNRSHPFFKRLIVADRHRAVVTPTKNRSPLKRQQVVTVDDDDEEPVPENLNSRTQNAMLDLTNDDESDNSDNKTNKKPKVTHLGIADRRTTNEIAFQVLDTSIPEVQYRRLSRNPQSAEIPTLDIRRLNMENLQSQGRMLDSFVVTAYFKTLGRQYYDMGVRVVDDTFMKWLATSTTEEMMQRYRLAEIDSAKILLIPIFNGIVSCGHYSLVVVDRLTSSLAYYGSYAGIDAPVCGEVLESLVKKRFAEKEMVTTRRIIEQGMNTNDCGAFCCCMASSHINAMTNLGILAQRKEQGTVVATTKVELTLEDPTLWGKYARHHIGEALHKQHIHMDDPSLLALTVEITRMMEQQK